MCPAAGLDPLRVAPEDPTAAEAGELVKKIGVGNQAKKLIAAVARQMPKELRIACQRTEHPERSEYLDPEEVLAQTEYTVGAENVIEILSARVKGNATRPADSKVIVLFLTPEGRPARCAIDYRLFKNSLEAFDNALKNGEVDLGSDKESAAGLRRQNERLRAELRAKVTGQPPAQGFPAGTQGEEAPNAAPNDNGTSTVELPEGVEAGDPGYPVDEESGDLLVLPDSVREDLIASAQTEQEAEGAQQEIDRLTAELEAAQVAPVGSEEEKPDAEVDLSTVELPEGNAETINAGLSFYDGDVVAALAEHGKTKSTREAATAELAKRNAPAEG
jgi:hypothetical protein